MSLSSWPKVCPKCGSKDFRELARIEAGEFTEGIRFPVRCDPPTDRAIYGCECGHEWEQ